MSHQLTFLFTDLEGSTRLWETYPQQMQAVMAKHDSMLRIAVESNAGRIVKTTGDGLHAVFASPLQALMAALGGQISIAAENWPETTGPMRVRMGIHAGESEERDGDYYGPTLNRAARIMSAGHGGQVLLSEIIAVSVRNALPEDITLRDLGDHTLRDLLSSERLYQLQHPALEVDFPPLKSLSAFKHNLPIQLNSFVGRENELDSILEHIQNTRLLTLLGPGGTGKTRLSVQAAADLLDQFPDGIWFIELAALTDPGLLPDEIAGVLRIQDQPGRSLKEAVGDYLRLKDALLIFDNVEHLVREAAELVEYLLLNCPKIRIMVTGREALFIGGETTLQIPSLSLPKKHGASTLKELSNSEAVQLFEERAKLALPSFTMNEDIAPAVAEIVLRLDGIPLALELAAARIRMMSVEQIAKRLSDRFRLLTGGQRTALPRQQTLQALIDWSYNLLDEDERKLFRRLSVFAGGWSLEAAEAVAGFDGLDVFFCLEQLVNKSLIVVDRTQEGEVRYRRLESIHQYSRDRLFESGEGEEVRAQHTAYYLAFAEEAAKHLSTRQSLEWYRRMSAEKENLRTAVEWALENRPGVALRITALLLEKDSFWISGHEAEAWLRKVIDQTRPLIHKEDTQVQRQDLARALSGLASYLGRTGYTHSVTPIIDEAIALAKMDGETAALAWAWTIRAMVAFFTLEPGVDGDPEDIREMKRALDFSREKGFDREQFTLATIIGGYYVTIEQDFEKGEPYLEEAIRHAHQVGDPRMIGITSEVIAYVNMLKGNFETAIEHFMKSHENLQAFGDQLRANGDLSAVGHIHRMMGDLNAAVTIYRKTIRIYQEIRHLPAIAHQLECFAYIAAYQAQPDKGARLLGAAHALREQLGEPIRNERELAEHTQAVKVLSEMLAEEDLQRLMQAGGQMNSDEAVDYALAD